jgi:heptaprenyl diphosphate synthase
MTPIKKIVTLALLTAVSLILFVVESQFPPITPIPGIKLGLANMVTLFILYRKGFKAIDAVLVIAARVILAALITGSLFSLMFSFCGGIAAVLTMILFRKLLGNKLIPVTSVAGAIAHNITQLTVALLVYMSMGILLYLPALMLGGILSGLITGIAITTILRRLRRE